MATALTAEPSGSRPRGRVCMFVYNSCFADARVLKEAATLRDAGYDVSIVAVLDKTTEPEEVRDGVRIVRVDRQPPHYTLLRKARQARRWLRHARPRARRALRRGSRGLLRAVRSGRRRAARLPLGLRRGRAAGFAGRVYRYARWRVLLHVPPVRRRYYRRRARQSKRLEQTTYEARIEAFRSRVRPQDTLGEIVVAVEAGAPARVPATAPAGDATATRLLAIVDRRVSHWCWKTVMTFHKPLMFLSYYRGAYRVARETEFDVLHAHDLLTLPVGALLSRRTGTPLVYDSHELYTEMSTLRRSERNVWTLLERLLIKRATRIITVCDSIAGELTSRYGVPTPLTLLNCPPRQHARPDRVASSLRAKIGDIDPRTRIVLYQGGLLPNRGLEELIDAAPDFDDATLVLMGWGRLEDELRAIVAERGELRGRVVITGPVPQQDLLAYTAGADLGVIPYKAVGLNNYYTTPNKLFEYLAAGIPIACSRFPELRRFVEGYGAGLTFDPESPQEIALAVNGILADPGILAEMRANSRRAGERFVWEAEAAKLIGVYEDVLSDRHRTRSAEPASA